MAWAAAAAVREWRGSAAEREEEDDELAAEERLTVERERER